MAFVGCRGPVSAVGNLLLLWWPAWAVVGLCSFSAFRVWFDSARVHKMLLVERIKYV